MPAIDNRDDNQSWTRGVLSALLWAAVAVIVAVWVVLLAVIYVFTVPSDPGRYTVGLWFRRAAVAFVAINPLWRFRTSGVVISDPRRPYVVIANHESYADIFLISHLPWEMKWLSKAEVMRVPLMGWLMRMAGDIPVHRGDSRSRAEAMNGIRDRLGKRVSVIVLPEGTRSPTDQLLPFRDGAFRIAVELGLPVLPIAVAGTRYAMAKGSFRFNRATAEARVLEPIETAHLTREDVPQLRDEVRNRIAAARDQLRQELGIAGADARS